MTRELTVEHLTIPAPNNTATLENIPPTHSILEQDGDTMTKYSEDPTSQRDLVELQEHFH